MALLPASAHPTGVRSTSIPGLLFSEGSQAFLIQNSFGDYLLRGVEFRIVLQRRYILALAPNLSIE